MLSGFQIACAQKSFLADIFCILLVSGAGWNGSKTARHADVPLSCLSTAATLVTVGSRVALRTSLGVAMALRLTAFLGLAFTNLGRSGLDLVRAGEIYSTTSTVKSIKAMHPRNRREISTPLAQDRLALALVLVDRHHRPLAPRLLQLRQRLHQWLNLPLHSLLRQALLASKIKYSTWNNR